MTIFTIKHMEKTYSTRLELMVTKSLKKVTKCVGNDVSNEVDKSSNEVDFKRHISCSDLDTLQRVEEANSDTSTPNLDTFASDSDTQSIDSDTFSSNYDTELRHLLSNHFRNRINPITDYGNQTRHLGGTWVVISHKIHRIVKYNPYKTDITMKFRIRVSTYFY